MTNDQDLEYVRLLASRGALPGNHASAEAAMAAIRIGREMSLPPNYSLRMINVSNGRVTIQAQAQLAAAAKVCPQLRWDIEESTPVKCTVAMARSPEHPLVKTTYTIEEARLAKITGSPTWSRYPTDMIYARAMTRALRRIVPECGGHDPDEIIGAEAPAVSSASKLDHLIPQKDPQE